jgi:uncharacterized protein (TIGR02246 family)
MIHLMAAPAREPAGPIYNRSMLRTLILALAIPALFAQSDPIRALMRDSQAAWNRGDLPAFASYYEDSPDTTFIGRTVTRGGVQAILDRYRKGYPTPEAMGKLTYSDIDVRPIADGLAIVTGRFELKRTAAGGGDAAGRYTLVLRRTSAGWKIIHDHSS